jgi:DNA-binding IclR family transcriptional regulator
VAPGARHRLLRRALYQDLCRAAAVSRSTLKRALKTLAQQKLVTVTWHAKRASLFQVWERKLAPTGRIDRGFAQARLYDLFSEEDHSLFLSTKRSLSPAVLKELEEEAGDPRTLDLLIFRRYFGPDRQRKSAHLTGSK